MKKDDFDFYIADMIKALSLKKEEKIDIRHRLKDFAQKNPVTRNTSTKIVSPYHGFSFYFTRYVSVFVLILLVSGGGVSVVAQKSLPGDSLYLVKTRFNEEVRGLVIFNPELKTLFEVEKAQERLMEARSLSQLGKLNPELKKEIFESFKNYERKVDQGLIELARSGKLKEAIDINDKVTDSLDDGGDIISELIKNEDKEKHNISDLSRSKSKTTDSEDNPNESDISPVMFSASSISEESADSTSVMMVASLPFSVAEPNDDVFNEVRSNIDNIVSLMAIKEKEGLSENDLKKVKEAIIKAESLFASGLEKYHEGDYAEYAVLLSKANRNVQKANILLVSYSSEKVKSDSE